MNRPATRIGSAALVVALTMISGATAMANDDDVIKRGNCSGRADWKLKAKPDDGRLEVEAEVDVNHNGQLWRWTIRHDGAVSAKGRARTHAPSGSFEVERRVVDASGRDHIVFRAVNVRNGQVCQGGLWI